MVAGEWPWKKQINKNRQTTINSQKPAGKQNNFNVCTKEGN